MDSLFSQNYQPFCGWFTKEAIILSFSCHPFCRISLIVSRPSKWDGFLLEVPDGFAQFMATERLVMSLRSIQIMALTGTSAANHHHDHATAIEQPNFD